VIRRQSRIAEAIDIRIRLKAKKVPDGFKPVRDRSREVFG
jgi:hypothetical protein